MKLLLTLASLAVLSLAAPIGSNNTFSSNRVGFAFSGAGGRIAQQAALAQTLINGTAPNGQKIIPAFLSGASSGALSVIGLNGALEYIYTNGARGWSVGAWNDFIFALRDNKVFRTGVRGFVSGVSNLDDGYILNNEPLVDTINSALRQLNYNVMGDLFLPSWITTVDQRTGDNLRLLSTDSQAKNIPLIQILMATTAIPIAFKPRSIPALTNNTLFVDGGTGIDYLPVIPLLEGGSNASTIYCFTPNQDKDNGNNNDNRAIEKNGIIRNALKAYEIQGNAKLTGDLAILANSDAGAYLYAAVLNRTFSTLNFDDEELQFNLVRDWARQNNPQELTNSVALDFNSVLPSYYSAQNDPYNTVNNGLFNSASTTSMCAVTLAVVIALVL